MRHPEAGEDQRGGDEGVEGRCGEGGQEEGLDEGLRLDKGEDGGGGVTCAAGAPSTEATVERRVA